MKEKLELINKIGTKGQIVIPKKIREALNLKAGDMVKQRVVNKKILITPVKKEEILREVKVLSKKISKKWPKGLTATEMIKKERE